MKRFQSPIRKRAALLGIVMLILLTAGSACACGSKNERAAKNKSEDTAYCRLSIVCETALESGRLDEAKKKVLPSDGVILAETKVELEEGDTVYDILQRETRSRKIQMESAESPLYESQYIEGIGNLYELDCGELSGWMYKVGDTFPRMGCSKYEAEAGDRIQWIYSCNLGKDIGGSNFQ